MMLSCIDEVQRRRGSRAAADFGLKKSDTKGKSTCQVGGAAEAADECQQHRAVHKAQHQRKVRA